MMQIILTHDNADFDAVGALLAAHKLHPAALPVLPVSLRRNVAHFLNLYWESLPFIRQSDLPRTRIERAILVDSQHLVNVKGMHPETSIEIVDHHDPRPDMPSRFQALIDPVGATCTLLSEQMIAAGTRLTPIEATLIALGIYEDTGSLSYGTTTHRDAYAAAWLLQQGAVLDSLREFLHFPLDENQRALYQELLENAHSISVQGHPVMVSAASARNMDSEVAVLAHRLRDFLDPTAVVILVELEKHIQLVARSIDDRVDVGKLARHFGGGGHARAAAARIRGLSLDDARSTVINLLSIMIQPGLTVADVMSHGVQTLAPDTRADEAAELMSRFGHEGFPILSDGKIIGLLTRRAVDRALYHGLEGIKVTQIMEPGNVTLSPDHSLADIRSLMLETGWGQIPIVDNKGSVIGVITRTDLIRASGIEPELMNRLPDIVNRLASTLSPVLLALVRETGQIADGLGLNLYIVGGFVRDLLLERPTTDIDFVVEGDAITLTEALVKRFGGESRSHGRFGTGKWLLSQEVWIQTGEMLGVNGVDLSALPSHIDFVTARTEFYDEPTALPTVLPGGIKLDLHRRDFTINTLAIRLNPRGFGQLLDHYGGLEDLQNKQIRALHSLSFVDDPTRMLRAVRFEQRFDFKIEPQTEQMIREWLAYLDRVSGDRVRHEIDLLLAEPSPERGLCRMNQLGLLKTIHPVLLCDEWIVEAFVAVRKAISAPAWPELGEAGFDPTVAYFGVMTYRMPPNAVWGTCKRLKVRRRTLDTLNQIRAIRDSMERLAAASKPSEIDSLLEGCNDLALLTLYAVSTSASRPKIATYASQYRHVKPLTSGDRLIAQGLKPGPHFKDILGKLRRARLDGEVSDNQSEIDLLDRLLQE